ncbi:hypothetical protein WN71_037600 [Streptomyces mangrovisoli]|uniref:Uncharacterized protein n=2 Tax=Streptomyces mangrovisoli TaxID=1428628 RepID=A0A1J4NK75_9ACTN|nr:hypothetical protein WN71_037600 [Streptomyces mangrovisoli]
MAEVGPDGSPRLVDLPGATLDEGLPLSAAARASRVAALQEAYDAYRARHGRARRLVVVVARRERPLPDAELAAALGGLRDAPEVRPLGAPHAVLALLRHRGAAGDGRYAVCDLGARAAEVTLCAVAGPSVAVLDGAEHAPAAGLGDAFDAALLAGAGLPHDAAGRAALAAARRGPDAGQRLRSALDRAARNPDVYDATTVYWLGERPVTVRDFRTALAAVTTALDGTLDTVGTGHAVVPVGGLARLAPLHTHLAARHRITGLAGTDVDPCHAAVLGAALVAAGLVDPGDRYPHAVCVSAHRMVGGRLRSEELEISPAGALEPGRAPVFAQSGGRPVNVRPAPGAQRRVVVGVRGTAGGPVLPVRTVHIPPGAPGDRCHLGVRLSADGVAHLVLRPVGATTTGTEIELGRLPVDLTRTHH